MSSLGNKITSVKRLSALAQLVEIYRKLEVTDRDQLAHVTGYSVRDIDRARDELRGLIPPGQIFRQGVRS